MIMIIKIVNDYPYYHWPLWVRIAFMVGAFIIASYRYKLFFLKKSLLIGRVRRDKN